MPVTASQVVEGLVSRGVPRNAAIGLAGNYQIESAGFQTGINEIAPVVPGSRGGFGLAQWTGPRRRQFEAFARSQGKPLDDLDTQLDFTVWELQNTEKKAADEIFAAQDPEEAARLVSERFLRPGIPHLERRLAAARDIASGELVGGAGDDTIAGGEGNDRQISVADLLRRNQERTQQQEQPDPLQAYGAAGALDVSALLAENERRQAPQEEGGFLRGVGLGTRDVIQGAASTLGIASDPVAAGINALFGTDIQPLRENVSGILTDLGVPEPETATERVLSSIVEGASGALTGAGVAGAAARGISAPVGRSVASQLAAAPAAQAAGGAGAGAGQQLAQEAGAGPVGQALAALGGGILAGGAAGTRVGPRRAGPAGAAPTSQPAPRPKTSIPAEEFGGTVRSAAAGSSAAKRRLAGAADIDSESVRAAERLGFNLPSDVFSDSQKLKEAVGLTRSVAGSPASAEWRDTITQSLDLADDVIARLGASDDLSDISNRVFRSLEGRIANLKKQSDFIYDKIDNALPGRTQIEPNNIVRALNREITDLGGTAGLSAHERRLFDVVTGEQPVTYARLMREKRQIGQALAGKSSPYADSDRALLSRLYDAISSDQVENVGRVLGDADVIDLRVATGLVAKRKELENSIVSAFGSDKEGSIANRLRLAVTQGSKGDISNLNRVIGVVPEKLRGEALISSLASLSRRRASSIGGASVPFGFSQYANLYRGLRANSKVYSEFARHLTKEQRSILQDLFVVSRRIAETDANILRTGKANQALFNDMTASGVIESILNSSAGRTTRAAAGTAAGGATGGPLTAIIGGALAGTPIGRDRMKLASDLFRSEEFQNLMVETAKTGNPSRGAIDSVSRSKTFLDWAKKSSIENPQQWLLGTVLASRNASEEEQQ